MLSKHKDDDRKIKKSVSLFSSTYLLFLAPSFSLCFSSLGGIVRPLGVVNPKCIWVIWCVRIDTIFINPVINILKFA